MISRYGENLKLSILGTSHGPEIGMTLEGIPAGLAVDFEALQQFLNRRAPGQNSWSTSRKEPDIPHFQSGIADGHTNAAAITAVIYNENTRSGDYEKLKNIPRPGHADFAAWMKYGLDFDMSGGGPFSGRMTAPVCIAGGLCKQWLEARGIRVGAHIARIGAVLDSAFKPLAPQLDEIGDDFPVLSEEQGQRMKDCIAEAKQRGDSIGGIVECAIIGLQPGLGGTLFQGLEGKIAQAVYGIPAVKGVEFGLGFENAVCHGSRANDEFFVENGQIHTKTNHCGGILGGISNGMPVIFRAAFKPTPSIAISQKSVNLRTMEEVTVTVSGRHDPCIVPRAVPVVEAAAAIAVFDLILGQSKR